MNAFLIFFTVLVVVCVWYALQGRAWLKSKPWAQRFFAWIEPAEILLFKKSETILFARAQQVIGVLLTVLTYAGSIDLSSIKAMAPPKIQWLFDMLPLAITALGMINEYLRNRTTKPVEVVAAPAAISPQAQAVVAAAEDATAVAVAAVKDEAAKAAS